MATSTLSMASSVVAQSIGSATPSGAPPVPPQGGILEGANPSVYSSSNPISTLIIQAGIIIVFCRLLHYPLSRIQQPRVIAEVIGGIVLGPSVMGHIPGFTAAIFPPSSIPTLSAVANIGLILFLFLVGLEVDLRFLVGNWRIALSVGALGMIFPFALGAAIAYGLYHQFANEPGTVPISFGVYLLFIGVAMAITAFPVLCRILTELKLLSTPVGVIVLSAGVGNDVVGWILLALCVALVNAGTGLTALWILLVAVAYTLFLAFAVRPCFVWVLRRSGSLQNGPTQSVIALTMLMVLVSAFFTGAIGVHQIFGAFMIGLICPHEGGFAVRVTEKVEDLVSVLFLPLYFALSGLSTNLGLLDNAITWAYVVGVICVAFFAKITGGTLAARLNGMVWRESFTIGTLMSCKGLVELIVLNIGLQAKILSTRTFTIFVVMALVTTFATTPLTSLLYPRWYQVKLDAWKKGEIDWVSGERINPDGSMSSSNLSMAKGDSSEINKIATYLRLDNMPGVLALVWLFAKPIALPATKVHPTKKVDTSPDSTGNIEKGFQRPLQIHGIRLTELTERESSVMKVSEVDEDALRDPVLNTFRTFGQLKNVAVSGSVIVAPISSYVSTLVERAREVAADLMLIPWTELGDMSEMQNSASEGNRGRFTNGIFSEFAAGAMDQATCNVAIFVDNGFGGKRQIPRPSLKRTVSALSSRSMHAVATAPIIERGHHVFLAYFGSEDDDLALRLVLQMAHNPTVTATIAYFELPEGMRQRTGEAALVQQEALPSSSPMDTTKQASSTVTPVASSTHHATFYTTMRDTLSQELRERVVFETIRTQSPADDATEKARRETGLDPKNAGDLVVVGRNSALAATLSKTQSEVAPALGSEVRKALGGLAEGMARSGVTASLLVVNAATRTTET